MPIGLQFPEASAENSNALKRPFSKMQRKIAMEMIRGSLQCERPIQ